MLQTKYYVSVTSTAFLMLVFSTPAFAYLDPGTGSALLQGILAALAAIAVTAKLYWHRLLRLLGLKRNGGADTRKSQSQQGSQGYSSEQAREENKH